MPFAPSLATLFCPAVHDARRSVAIVRVGVALLILIHPLHTLASPGAVRDLGTVLAAHGFPWGVGVRR